MSLVTPDLAVIIPHYDDLKRLHRCLLALTAQDTSGTEIIVSDNHTPGGIGELLHDFPSIRVVFQPERGAAAARNKGVEETTASWLLFLDADCVPAPDWLREARQIMAGDCRTVSGGRIDVFDETPKPRSGAEAFETVFAFDQESYIKKKGFLVTANLLVPRAVIERVGPFVIGKSEDLDWCRRATAAGYSLNYVSGLVVSHPTRQNWVALKKKWRRLTTESFGLLDPSAKARVTWALRAAAMPASVVAHLPRIMFHPTLSKSERCAAAATLVRLRLMRMGWMLDQALSGRASGFATPPSSGEV